LSDPETEDEEESGSEEVSMSVASNVMTAYSCSQQSCLFVYSNQCLLQEFQTADHLAEAAYTSTQEDGDADSPHAARHDEGMEQILLLRIILSLSLPAHYSSGQFIK